MLVNSYADIVCKTDIQNVMIFISKHVNKILLHSLKLQSPKYLKKKMSERKIWFIKRFRIAIPAEAGISFPHSQRLSFPRRREPHLLAHAQCHYLRITILTNSGSPSLLQNALSFWRRPEPSAPLNNDIERTRAACARTLIQNRLIKSKLNNNYTYHCERYSVIASATL